MTEPSRPQCLGVVSPPVVCVAAALDSISLGFVARERGSPRRPVVSFGRRPATPQPLTATLQKVLPVVANDELAAVAFTVDHAAGPPKFG